MSNLPNVASMSLDSLKDKGLTAPAPRGMDLRPHGPSPNAVDDRIVCILAECVTNLSCTSLIAPLCLSTCWKVIGLGPT